MARPSRSRTASRTPGSIECRDTGDVPNDPPSRYQQHADQGVCLVRQSGDSATVIPDTTQGGRDDTTGVRSDDTNGIASVKDVDLKLEVVVIPQG